MIQVRRRSAWSAALLAAAVATAGGVAWGLSGSPAHGRAQAPTPGDYPGLPHTAVNVSEGGCGGGWSSGRSGLQVFDVRDSSTGNADVQLVEPSSGRVVGEVEGLAAGTSRPLVVRLAAGSYAFRCMLTDTDAVTGPTVAVSGSGAGTAGVVPVTQQDLIPAAQAYQKWVAAQLPTLLAEVTTLRSDIAAGDLARARADWLTAHLSYERLGAAYGAFGDADEAINGTGHGATGFHRVEYGLWHGESAASLAAPAARLVQDVRSLQRGWAGTQFDPQLLGVRAHEIVENTVQFELTGRTDEGSGSNLRTAQANLDGTDEALGLLRPLLRSRLPLARVDAALSAARSELRALGGVPLAQLSRSQRELLNARFGALVEQLAPVAAVCDERRTS